MASEDGQGQEKVLLKRKLTGPPRLLLGKSKSKTQGHDRSEARKKRNKGLTVNNGTLIGSSVKHPNTASAEEEGSPTITSDKLHITLSKSEEHDLPDKLAEPRCSIPGDAGEHPMVEHPKVKKSVKHSWRRIFSPAVICTRRQNKDSETSVKDEGIEIPRSNNGKEEMSLEDDTVSLKGKRIQDASDNIVKKRKGRFTIRTWPTIRRFLTSSQVRQNSKTQRRVIHDGFKNIQYPPVTFRKKLQHFLIYGRRMPSPADPLVQEHLQEPGDLEAEIQPASTQPQCSTTGRIDSVFGDGKEVGGQCTQRVTVSAEVSTLLSGEDTEEPEVCLPKMKDLKDSQAEAMERTVTLGTESSVKTKDKLTCATSTDSPVHDEAVDVAMDANEAHTDQPYQICRLEIKEAAETVDGAIFNAVVTVAMDTNECLCNPNSILSFENAGGEENEDTAEMGDDIISRTTEVAEVSQNGQTLPNIGLNGLSVSQCTFCEINSNSVTNLNVTNQDDHIPGDDGFATGLTMEDNQNMVCRETQLVQTACSLVQAAMRAAVEQLSMERQGDVTSVHREAQGCRDHA